VQLLPLWYSKWI